MKKQKVGKKEEGINRGNHVKNNSAKPTERNQL